ncbi:unnamed protein product [Sympodiomycopsis kandeliae]
MAGVNVLILGGLTHVARPLIHYLTDSKLWEGDDKRPDNVKHIRVVDRYLVRPGSTTTWVDPVVTEILATKSNVEYLQRNLSLESVASQVFDVPEEHGGGVYDYVFDFTGDGVLTDMAPGLLLERTTRLAGRLARVAASKGVKAYIRDTQPFYTVKPDDPVPNEENLFAIRSPKSVRAYYWAEAERAAANVPNLNLVILRSAGLYGGFIYTPPIIPRFTTGQLYQFTKDELVILWGPNLRVESVHSFDFCRAAWSAAEWMAANGRAAADASAAGVNLSPVDSKSLRVTPTASEQIPNDATAAVDLCPKSKTVRAPVFNVADDNATTQATMAEIVKGVFGVETQWAGTAATTWAKMNLGGVLDDANEEHMEKAAKMIANSKTSLVNTPFSAFLDIDVLSNRATKMDNSRIKKVLGWHPKHAPTVELFREMLQDFRSSNVFYVPPSP